MFEIMVFWNFFFNKKNTEQLYQQTSMKKNIQIYNTEYNSNFVNKLKQKISTKTNSKHVNN